MRLWDFVLRQDAKLDLSAVSTAKAWSRDLVFSMKRGSNKKDPLEQELRFSLLGMSTSMPDDEDAVGWRKDVWALRKRAASLHGVEVRECPISDSEADRIFTTYIGMIDQGTQIDLMNWRAFKGADISAYNFAIPACQFWQQIFGSMAFEASFPGICGSCFKDLGYTPTGRPRRGDFCKSCLNRIAFETLPIEEQRRLNRERQASRRKKLREEAGDGIA